MRLIRVLTIVLPIFLKAIGSEPVIYNVFEPLITLSTIESSTVGQIEVVDPIDPDQSLILSDLTVIEGPRISGISDGTTYFLCITEAESVPSYNDFFHIKNFMRYGGDGQPVLVEQINDAISGTYYAVVSTIYISCSSIENSFSFNVYRIENDEMHEYSKFEFERLTGIETDIGDPLDDENQPTVFGKFSGLQIQYSSIDNSLSGDLGSNLDVANADGSVHAKLKLANDLIETLTTTKIGDSSNAPDASGSVHAKLKLANDLIETLTTTKIGDSSNAPDASGSVHAKLKLANDLIETLSTTKIGDSSNAADDAGSLHAKLKFANDVIETLSTTKIGDSSNAPDATGSLHAKLKFANDEINDLSDNLGSDLDDSSADGSVHAKLKHANAEISGLSTQITTLDGKVDTDLGSDLDDANADGSVHAKLKLANNEISSLSTQVTTLDSKVNDLINQVANLATGVKDVKDLIGDIPDAKSTRNGENVRSNDDQPADNLFDHISNGNEDTEAVKADVKALSKIVKGLVITVLVLVALIFAGLISGVLYYFLARK